MRFITILTFVCCLLWAVDDSPKPQSSKTERRSGQKAATLTGCIDQRGETYVLADDQMQREAKLRAKAFSDDNFARFIGHRVRVFGEMDQSSGSDVFNVTKIEDVSQTCNTK